MVWFYHSKYHFFRLFRRLYNFVKNSIFHHEDYLFFLDCLDDYIISLRILYFIMKIVFVFVCGKNCKFCFCFKCLEDLSNTVRIMYFILKIDSLKFFTIIYIDLHDCLPISSLSFTISIRLQY